MGEAGYQYNWLAKMKPTRGIKKMADKNGRIEGWFRAYNMAG
jgi:hypothetical protein